MDESGLVIVVGMMPDELDGHKLGQLVGWDRNSSEASR
jgi:hypothetical protein